MTNRIETDICVIGAGSGGLSVAAGAVQMGARVVLIEGHKMGGDCLNYGCVPSKALIAAAKQAHTVRKGGFGIAPAEPVIDYSAAKDHVHDVIATIEPVDSQERFEGLGVHVIREMAEFTSPTEVKAGDTIITARRFVIATGSRPFVPPIPGIDSVPYLTNESLFDLRDRPEHLIVIGGGPIGMEMAQAHVRLGSKVTVLEGMKALGKDDPEMAAIALERLRGEGIEIVEGAQVSEVSGEAGNITVTTEDGRSFNGSHLLMAVGRAVNVDKLNLEAAGVDYDRRGVKVDASLRTTNKKVYAAGDVAGGLQFTHVAGYHAGVLIRQLVLGMPAKARTDHIPWATYTDPEIAQVGLTEAQARKAHGDKLEVARFEFNENDRAIASGRTTGLIKVMVSKGKPIGASIVGADAGELIGLWAYAIANGHKMSAVANMVAPYPTLGEVNKRAAGAYFSPRLFESDLIKRIVRIVQRFRRAYVRTQKGAASLNSLSGRFLILTVVFVMLAEVLIFVPSVARFREDYLLNRLERAQIASLALLATPDDMVAPELEAELLANAEVFNIVLQRDEVRELILNQPIPDEIYGTYDLRDPSAFELIRDALRNIVMTEDHVIRVIGTPVRGAGEVIEVTMTTGPLRAALIDYGIRILILSAAISIFTATLLFLAVRSFLVKPMRRVVDHMTAYAEAPEDARRVITPDAGVAELRDAENALMSLQTQLTQALKQKDRLAQLGGAVAKISHDLRNVLTVAQLLADRIETSEDPTVKRAAPKLVNAISRAVTLCESTLAFGKAEERAPELTRLQLGPLVEDVLGSEELSCQTNELTFLSDIPPGMTVRGDTEQLYRVLTNLVRNARQAIEATGNPGQICITAREDEIEWIICVADTGPGLPPKARENLFTAFQGGARKGGTGLGLVIAAELIRGHGGALELKGSDENGTEFRIRLPRTGALLDAAAE